MSDAAAETAGTATNVVMKHLGAFIDFENTFQGQDWIDFTRDHAEIPIFAVSFYLGMVFYVPAMLKSNDIKPLKLKTLFAGWNLFLSLFSILGTTRTLPHLLDAFARHGFTFTVCKDPIHWYLNGPSGLWVGLFIFSKIPELLDTVFLVLMRKPVIFLHWFHHVTVMLYCWHAYHNRIAPGLWFASMNFAVHSIMYMYYFAMAANVGRAITKTLAPFITTIQILQMAVGSAVTVHSAHQHWTGGDAECKVDPANYKMGLAMYGSYFVLFSILFGNKYLSKDEKPNSASRICGVDLGSGRGGVDTAGRFEEFPSTLTKSGSGNSLGPDSPVTAPKNFPLSKRNGDKKDK